MFKVFWFIIVLFWAMLLTFISDFSTSALYSNNEALKVIKMQAKSSMVKMTDKDRMLYFLDLVQDKLDCCGIDGVDDYYRKNITSLPPSCINQKIGYAYEKGCYDAVIDHYKNKPSGYYALFNTIFVLQILILLGTGIFMLGILDGKSSSKSSSRK